MTDTESKKDSKVGLGIGGFIVIGIVWYFVAMIGGSVQGNVECAKYGYSGSKVTADNTVYCTRTVGGSDQVVPLETAKYSW